MADSVPKAKKIYYSEAGVVIVTLSLKHRHSTQKKLSKVKSSSSMSTYIVYSLIRYLLHHSRELFVDLRVKWDLGYFNLGLEINFICFKNVSRGMALIIHLGLTLDSFWDKK